MSNTSIWHIDRTLSGATSLSQSGPGSDANKEELGISQSSSINGASPSDCLVSYPGHTLGGVGDTYSSAEMQLVYSTAPGNWATELKTHCWMQSSVTHRTHYPSLKALCLHYCNNNEIKDTRSISLYTYNSVCSCPSISIYGSVCSYLSIYLWLSLFINRLIHSVDIHTQLLIIKEIENMYW